LESGDSLLNVHSLSCPLSATHLSKLSPECSVVDATELAPVKTRFIDWSLVIATIVFTYDGWLYACYFSGAIKGGAGPLVRSSIKGVVITTASSMLLNAACIPETPTRLLA